MRPKESKQYTLPPGCISEPLPASDGSIWVNHSSGFFRLFNGEVTPVIQYDECGIQPGYVSNLNPYRYATYLPPPVLVHDQIYISCHAGGAAWVMCFSLDASLLWKRNVGTSCPNLLSNSMGAYALHFDSIKEITNGAGSNVGISIPAGKMIGYLTVKDHFFFAIIADEKIRLLQISPELKIESDFLLDDVDAGLDGLKFGIYPILAANDQNIFLFFPVIEPPFTGLEEYRFLFRKNSTLEFQGKNSYGVTSRSKTTYSWVSSVFANEEGFSFINDLCAGSDIYNRLWQVDTKTDTVCIQKIPAEIQNFSSCQKVLHTDKSFYIPCEDIHGKTFIGRFCDGQFTKKKSPNFTNWFFRNKRIWICLDKKKEYVLRQFPDWPEV